jgi:DNA end-binding protein Ku
MLELAMHIVDTKRGKFEPLKFEDEYEDALQELLKKKQKGEKIERAKEPARSNVIDLMDALRQSVKSQRSGRERGGSEKPRPRAPKKTRASARHKEAS